MNLRKKVAFVKKAAEARISEELRRRGHTVVRDEKYPEHLRVDDVLLLFCWKQQPVASYLGNDWKDILGLQIPGVDSADYRILLRGKTFKPSRRNGGFSISKICDHLEHAVKLKKEDQAKATAEAAELEHWSYQVKPLQEAWPQARLKAHTDGIEVKLPHMDADTARLVLGLFYGEK